MNICVVCGEPAVGGTRAGAFCSEGCARNFHGADGSDSGFALAAKWDKDLPPLPHALAVHLHTITKHGDCDYSRRASLNDLRHLLDVLGADDLEQVRAWVVQAISRENAMTARTL